MADVYEKALAAHRAWRGKLETGLRAPADTKEDLTLCYTPGVAEPCREIARDKEQVWALTRRWNTVAVVTDGSAVLGLGNIGPEAGLPVMEGKAVLFKRFGGVDAVPICLSSQNVDDIVRAVELIAPSFGGINREDIAAPRCFEVEARLRASLSIPVFHDDQHGTAVVVLAALTNAARAVGKTLQSMRVVICGAGAAGCAIAGLLQGAAVGDVVLVDKTGILDPADAALDKVRRALAGRTNKAGLRGALADALHGADVFIGVSGPGALPAALIPTMAASPIVFAMANPTPEIDPAAARQAGAAVVGTGRSDYPNQINTVMCFPGLFRGLFDARAARVTTPMLVAAAQALAALVDPTPEQILPPATDERIAPAVAKAVVRACEAGA